MIRVTNKKEHAPNIVYVDRPVVQKVEVEKAVVSEPQVIFQDREVIKEVPVEKIVEKVVEKEVDLSPIHEKLDNHATSLQNLYNWCHAAKNELELQRRALVGVKAQRDIDRSRRLMLIRRIKKEKVHHQKVMMGVKIIIMVNLFITLCHFIIR